MLRRLFWPSRVSNLNRSPRITFCASTSASRRRKLKLNRGSRGTSPQFHPRAGPQTYRQGKMRWIHWRTMSRSLHQLPRNASHMWSLDSNRLSRMKLIRSRSKRLSRNSKLTISWWSYLIRPEIFIKGMHWIKWMTVSTRQKTDTFQ